MASNNTDEILSTVATSDKSVGFFNDIFGTGWQNILEGHSSSGGAGSVMFELFFAFNAVTLAGVTVLMFYMVSSGVVGTAHEGEALGRRYSTLWTPLRSALAISFLMPLPWAKLSLLQALILKFMFLSIGGANYLANHTVEYMVKQGGAITSPRAPLPFAEGLAEEMLKNLVIQEYYKERENQPYEGNGIEDTSSDEVKSFWFSSPGGSMIYTPFMGRVKTSCLSASDELCIKEHELGKELANDLRPIAQAIVSQWSEGSNTPMDQSQEDSYRVAIDKYASASQQAATEAMLAIGPNEKLTELSQAVENNGWTWLGVYYWKIAKYNEEAMQKVQTKVAVSSLMNDYALSLMAGDELDASLMRYRDFVGKIARGRIQQRQLANTTSDTAGAWSLLGSLFYDAIGSSIFETLEENGGNTAVTGAAQILASAIAKGDPIDNLQKLGHQLVNAGSNMLLVSAAAGAGGWLADVVGTATNSVPIVGEGASAVSGSAAKVFKAISGFLMPIGLTLIGVGVTLAYYLPTLPFILWTSAIVGWLVLSLELMVAAPIWAAMHAIPEGEGMAGQHGRQGYMLFLGILMRPSLHVMGFFMSFVVVTVIGHFIGESYLDFSVASGRDSQPLGPVSQIVAWFATILLGGVLAVVSTHKGFSLITWLPDNLLRWGGAGTPSLGEHGDESRVSQMFGIAIAATRGTAMSGISGGLAKATNPAGPGNGGPAAGGPAAKNQHSLGNKQDNPKKLNR